jgi:SpoVK/Ycf46/Vps4 family AAA+-type ATPase
VRRPEVEIGELWAARAPVLYLVTVEEARAVAVCRAAADAADANLAVWSSQRGLEPLAPSARTPIAAIQAALQAPAPLLAVLLDFHEALADPAVVRTLRDALPRLSAEGRCLVIVAPRLDLPDGLAAEAAVIRLPLPSEVELETVLDSLSPPPDVAREDRNRVLVAARGLTESQARRAFGRALHADPRLGKDAAALVLEEKKRILSRDLGLELVETTEAADALGGLESFKAWMEERSLAFAADARLYGLPPPRGVLLVGVQGCGKSLAAKVAASQLGVPLLRLDLPRVMGAGEGAEENLARALAAAEAVAPVAVWVDEIEKAFAGSGPGQGSDARAARLLGSFSTWLQERAGAVFAVATANDVSRLPPELLRRGRFDELFFVDLPDAASRRAILALHLRKRGRDPGKFDLALLADASENFSGAELEQVVVGALHRAFAQGRDLEMSDLRRVSQDLVPLFKTYEEEIKALREWSRGRARAAGREGAVVDLFRRSGA